MSNYLNQQQQFQDQSHYLTSFYEQYLSFRHNNHLQEIKDDSYSGDKQSQIYEESYSQIQDLDIQQQTNLQQQIKTSSEDEIATAYNQVDFYFKNYIKTKYQSDSLKNPNFSKYLMYSQTRSNFNSMDLELHSNMYTKDLLNLLKPDIQMLDFIKSFNQPFSLPQGEKRFQSMIKIHLPRKHSKCSNHIFGKGRSRDNNGCRL
ncbi:hypothetical protein ABPG72_009891 [Tetrahymena utriculariae]